MIVMKFGGTSVQDADAIRRVSAIVLRAHDRGAAPLVVVSAMARVTDQLIQAATLAAQGARAACASLVQQLVDRHGAVVEAVLPETHRAGLIAALAADWHDAIARLDAVIRARELTPGARDAIVATGEIASSRVLTMALQAVGVPAVWVDARRVLVTDEEHGAAQPDMAATRARVLEEMQPHLAAGRIPVAGGFIGATTQGAVSTLGRGGSDYSASIFGALLGATEIQIWTDVDGMLTADPRVIAGTRPVATLSFVEAYELACFGAKVLHPSAIAPAAAAHIPLRILNSYGAEGPGTTITTSPPRSLTPITSLACKRDVTVIEIASSPRTPGAAAHDDMGRILDVFTRHRTSVEVVTATETGVTVTIDDTRHLAAILVALQQFGEVSAEREMALLCAVGERLRTDPSLSAQIRAALDGVPLRAVSQESRTHMIIVMSQGELANAMALVHGRFCVADHDGDAAVRPATACGVDERAVAV